MSDKQQIDAFRQWQKNKSTHTTPARVRGPPSDAIPIPITTTRNGVVPRTTNILIDPSESEEGEESDISENSSDLDLGIDFGKKSENDDDDASDDLLNFGDIEDDIMMATSNTSLRAPAPAQKSAQPTVKWSSLV